MDFDDTWHPATHPSGAVLPALLALAESLPSRPSGLDLLLAFNVGIEVQGRLMRFSTEAYNIPQRSFDIPLLSINAACRFPVQFDWIYSGCIWALKGWFAPIIKVLLEDKEVKVVNRFFVVVAAFGNYLEVSTEIFGGSKLQKHKKKEIQN